MSQGWQGRQGGQGWQDWQWQGRTGWEGWQGWQQEAASSNKRKAGGYAPDDPDGPQAAAAQKFAKRSRFEQNLFETAASLSAEYRVAAFGREELHPPEEYLVVNFPRGGVQIFRS